MTAKFFYRVVRLPIGDAGRDTDSFAVDGNDTIVSEQIVYDESGPHVQVLIRHWQPAYER